MAGLSIAAASSQAWAEMGAQAERAFNTGWILDQVVTSTGGFTTLAAPSTATAFLSSGDGTSGSGNSMWALGRLVRVVHTGGTAYAGILSASFAGGVTTVGIGDFQSGGTTSLSTTAITTAAAAINFNGPTGNEYTKVRVINRTTTTVVASTATVTSDSTFYTYTVPAGVMGTSGILRLSLFGDYLNNSGATPPSAWKFLFGATTVLANTTTVTNVGIETSANRRYWRAQFIIQNVSATNSQRAYAQLFISDAIATSFELSRNWGAAGRELVAEGYGTATEASSANLALSCVFRMTSTATTVDAQLRHGFLELVQ